MEGLISSMHGNRSPYSDNSFAPINFASKESTKAGAGQSPIATGSLSHRKRVTKTDRPIRPIPPHKKLPPMLLAEPEHLARQITKEAGTTRESKRPRREAQARSPESSSVRLRRRRGEHDSKGTAGRSK